MRTMTIPPYQHPMRSMLEQQDSATLARWVDEYADNLNLDMMRLCQFILANRPAAVEQPQQLAVAA